MSPVKRESNFQLALEDIVRGVLSLHIWAVLGWQEVRQRYRRSVIGPFWITISTAAMVGMMGPLYAKLFNQDMGSYFAHLAISIVLWQFVSQTINDTCRSFIDSEGYIKQVKLPLTVYVAAVVWKNLIIFAHNFLVIGIVMVYFRPSIGSALLLVPIAIIALALNGFIFGTILASLSARFRDVPLILVNIVQVSFFLTPVMWQPQMLGRHMWVVNLNPFYHFLEVVRAPLLGLPTNVWSWPAVAMISLFGVASMLGLFSRFRARIAYWV